MSIVRTARTVGRNAGRQIQSMSVPLLASLLSSKQRRDLAKGFVKTANGYVSKGSTTIGPYKRTAGSVRELGGKRVKFQRGKKLKVFNPAPKGKAKKFVKKVMKAISSTGAYGEYRYIGAAQLRQLTLNTYGQAATDINVIPFAMDMKSSWDANSILWTAKVPVFDYLNPTGNSISTVPFNVLRNDMSFFFKSTSGHVVNIEAYECTYKMPTSFDPFGLAIQSVNDIELLYKQGTAGSGVPAAAANTFQYGMQIPMYATLMKYCHVKKHNIKLKPGDHASLYIKGPKGVLDVSKNIKDDDVVPTFIRGSKCMYFRIINDPTISGGTSEVNHWPSNEIGGVAMEYTRVIRVQAPVSQGSTALARNRIVILRTSENGTGTDQQVSLALQSVALPQ